jgi:hypothetical protein
MAAMGIIGGLFSLVGSIASANALQKQAAAERNAAQFNAQVEEQRAMEDRAAAQRKSFQDKETKDLTLSKLQARAAASGGGAGPNDPSIIGLASDIEGKGTYQSLADMYVGESRGRMAEDNAAIGQYIGQTKADADEAKAFGTILGGVGGLVGKFGKGFG